VSLVVLDTDVASAILRAWVGERLRARLAGKTLCISFVTLGELTKWTALRDWGPRRLAELADWRRHVVVLPFDEAVATTWGELQAMRSVVDARVRSMTHGLPPAFCFSDCHWQPSTPRISRTSPSTTA
jgi:hypothetical protein